MENTIVVTSNGTLTCNGKTYRCALGKGGVSLDKKEGDGATPVGCFPMRKVYYRPDKIVAPATGLPVEALTETSGWADDAERPEYNMFVELPYDGSHEALWREDDVYDIIVPLGYNDGPIVPGKGSAIFMHVARETYSPTAGCIALSLTDLLEVLTSCDAETQVCVRE
ncbi:MAG: L,D-transpeptidase family protein [Candidatus Yonathbacteria bacterium]|nr:L,D-transpeptidase family protein [Candidatus Yonathbacteria bacterium]